jgi:hypothetical protein
LRSPGEVVSFIPEARLWLPVRRNAEVFDLGSSNGNELWSTRRLIVQRLEMGDDVTLWPTEDKDEYDAAGGPAWPVREVFWDSDGIMHATLALMILDPSAEVRAEFYSKMSRCTDQEDFFSKKLWWTDDGSDFTMNMRKGGWTQ